MGGKKQLWWGYLHKSGSVHAKRFFSDDDISDARLSSFCVKTTGPFYASSMEEALSILTGKLKAVLLYSINHE